MRRNEVKNPSAGLNFYWAFNNRFGNPSSQAVNNIKALEIKPKLRSPSCYAVLPTLNSILYSRIKWTWLFTFMKCTNMICKAVFETHHHKTLRNYNYRTFCSRLIRNIKKYHSLFFLHRISIRSNEYPQSEKTFQQLYLVPKVNLQLSPTANNNSYCYLYYERPVFHHNLLLYIHT